MIDGNGHFEPKEKVLRCAICCGCVPVIDIEAVPKATPEHKPNGLAKLSGKQFRFVTEVVAGNTLVESYRRSYNCVRSSTRTIACEASKLANSPKIASIIARSREAEFRFAAQRGEEKRLRIEKRLDELLDHPRPHIALRAAKFYGELYNVRAFAKSGHQEDDPESAFDALARITAEVDLRSTNVVEGRAFDDAVPGGAGAFRETVDSGE